MITMCLKHQDGCPHFHHCSMAGYCLEVEPGTPEKLKKALQDILTVTEATQERPYTALSKIDDIAREALR